MTLNFVISLFVSNFDDLPSILIHSLRTSFIRIPQAQYWMWTGRSLGDEHLLIEKLSLSLSKFQKRLFQKLKAFDPLKFSIF